MAPIFFPRLTFALSTANVSWVVRSVWKVGPHYTTGVSQVRWMRHH